MTSSRNNAVVLDELLATDPQEPMTVPTSALLDWINTIPEPNVHEAAVTAYLRRDPTAASFLGKQPRTDPQEGAHAAWLAADFDPPIYSTDDETGERRLLSRRFVEESHLLSNKPQKQYRLPAGMKLMDWMKLGESDREAHIVWSDWDGNDYDRLADGSFVRKAKS